MAEMAEIAAFALLFSRNTLLVFEVATGVGVVVGIGLSVEMGPVGVAVGCSMLLGLLVRTDTAFGLLFRRMTFFLPLFLVVERARVEVVGTTADKGAVGRPLLLLLLLLPFIFDCRLCARVIIF